MTFTADLAQFRPHADSRVELVPLSLDHEEALAQAAADGELWTLRYTAVPTRDEMRPYIETALAMAPRGAQVPFVVCDRDTQRIVGCTRYYSIDDALRRVYIGWTWYAASVQRTHVNTSAKLELLRHAFDECHANVVAWETDILNTRSQQAIERLGARREGVLRHHMLRRDKTPRDTVAYSMLAAEWPAARKRLLARLAAFASTSR